MSEKPLFEASNLTYHYRVFHNRLEIEVTPFPFPSKKDIILFRNITESSAPLVSAWRSTPPTARNLSST